MNFTEIIEKLKLNLQLQSELKTELTAAETNVESCTSAINNAKTMLAESRAERVHLRKGLIDGLKKSTSKLSSSVFAGLERIYGEAVYYGIRFKFLNKEYDLLNLDHAIMLKEDADVEHVLPAADFAEQLFDMYLMTGDEMFNKEGLAEINKIKHYYKLHPEAAKEKMLNTVVDPKISEKAAKSAELNERLAEAQTRYSEVKESIGDTTVTIEPTLMNKIFKNKQLKKQQELAALEAEIAKIKKELADLEASFGDKTAMKTASSTYVNDSLIALFDCLGWIESFKGLRTNMLNCDHAIATEEARIKSMERDLLILKSKIKEIKTRMQLNKKSSNDLVEKVFEDQEFVAEMESVDMSTVTDEDKQAIKFVKGKYKEYIQDCIGTLLD